MQPVVSVIIPIYNVEKYVAHCLDSVLHQTFTDFEALLVDDCGSDGSMAIVEQYPARDPRFRILRHETNRGLSAARNTGLHQAQGKYVYFLDSDDWVDEKLLEATLDAMEKDGLDICRFDGLAHDERPLRHAVSPIPSAAGEDVLSGCDYIDLAAKNGSYYCSVCFTVFRRDFLFAHHLVFADGLLYEDNLFLLNALLVANRMRHLPYAAYHRRVHANSIVTSRPTLRNLKDFFLILLRMHALGSLDSLPQAGQNAIAVQMGNMLYLMRIVNSNLKKGEWKQLRESLSPEDFLLLRAMLEPDDALTARLDSMQKTPDYRIGSAILYLPRMIWRPIYRTYKRFMHRPF